MTQTPQGGPAEPTPEPDPGAPAPSPAPAGYPAGQPDRIEASAPYPDQEYGSYPQGYGQQGYSNATPEPAPGGYPTAPVDPQAWPAGGAGQPGYDPQAYGQPNYAAASPYGQPVPDPQAYPYAQPQGYGPQGYPQQPGYDPQHHPAPAYPTANQPYAAASVGAATAPAPRSPMLGMISLGVVVLMTVLLCVSSFQMGVGTGDFLLAYGLAASQNPDPTDPRIIALGEQLTIWSYLGGLASVAGLAAWIAGIVAMARRSGRGWGLFAVILGVLAPLLGFVAVMVGLWPAIMALA
ncbi:MAG: hypothetical protein ACK5LS_05340 [Propioniciclava sp.]